jgi:hypothetical protein
MAFWRQKGIERTLLLALTTGPRPSIGGNTGGAPRGTDVPGVNRTRGCEAKSRRCFISCGRIAFADCGNMKPSVRKKRGKSSSLSHVLASAVGEVAWVHTILLYFSPNEYSVYIADCLILDSQALECLRRK